MERDDLLAGSAMILVISLGIIITYLMGTVGFFLPLLVGIVTLVISLYVLVRTAWSA